MDSAKSEVPIGLRWRSSVWFTTLVVGLGMTTDLVAYSIITPAMPFQLQKLGYSGISALVGWLLFAYSAGLVTSAIPIAMFSERHNTRKTPMVVGLIILVVSQIMFMEAPVYSVMCIARVLQGIGSSIVWVVGLALLCDATPEHSLGRQLGIAMSGLSLGVIVGPPIGGALYSRFGFRGPFVFGLGVTALDLVGRLLVIERKDALSWKEESFAFPSANNQTQNEITADAKLISGNQCLSHSLSLLSVIWKLSRSSRALAAFVVTFVYGMVYAGPEPSIVLHLQSVWRMDSRKVGLVFLAAIFPTLLSSILTGWYADRKGVEWITFGSLLLAFPWWIILTIRGPVALFVVALTAEYFFVSGVPSPLTAELASISRDIDGVGYAHVYGAFNIAYGIGSAVGPVVTGQIYDNVNDGWTTVCLLAMSLILACLIISVLYTGIDPLYNRFLRFLRGQRMLLVD